MKYAAAHIINPTATDPIAIPAICPPVRPNCVRHPWENSVDLREVNEEVTDVVASLVGLLVVWDLDPAEGNEELDAAGVTSVGPLAVIMRRACQNDFIYMSSREENIHEEIGPPPDPVVVVAKTKIF
ncbi:hypothetical protein TSTA_012820 [Talaromyces stipitatus ATCC 10500]|uniref:Uncharacterized protein n=1 Tax=Talaromyces stipitatus (strain ATCC 10500 / CBS 375.48 / QM 6759 / NRRL 1006) TaxID=441959 RepID=B8MF76_TALSN|nr:uncharacterized protein TSTA_012820 [Talaromyces stipitatus ATCC 10500]EED16175.1 hypothetical protein TSTA_012820 [Talaromyces stipitatus ATCC 10500]